MSNRGRAKFVRRGHAAPLAVLVRSAAWLAELKAPRQSRFHYAQHYTQKHAWQGRAELSGCVTTGTNKERPVPFTDVNLNQESKLATARHKHHVCLILFSLLCGREPHLCGGLESCGKMAVSAGARATHTSGHTPLRYECTCGFTVCVSQSIQSGESIAGITGEMIQFSHTLPRYIARTTVVVHTPITHTYLGRER